MNEKLIVPKGIRYISQWQDFKLDDYPHIMNKQIPGCGFTEWCLVNGENIILCSPRRILLQNKFDQHQGEVFLVMNNQEEKFSPDKDLSRGLSIENSLKKKDLSLPENVKTEINLVDLVDETEEVDKNVYQELRNNIREYIISRKISKQPCKILVTYDSFGLVKDILYSLGYFFEFRVIIDEFQSIFVDSRFKPSTEIKFLSYLDGVQKVCYVSATPMMKEYLSMMPEFKDLPYYELDWETDQPERISKPNLKVRYTRSVTEAAKNIIIPYKEGKFDVKYVKRQGQPQAIESKEAVIYVNSVNNIISIIKKFDLKPEEVNILCSNTIDNANKVKNKLGQGFSIGRVPLRGEQHKMFTFCTRTVYLGADFYSTTARTFIISDANIETLAVDISLDLPQILGRQRLEENPWKNSAEFYYKPLALKNRTDREEFDNLIATKDATTQGAIKNYETIAENSPDTLDVLIGGYADLIKVNNYRKDYLSLKPIHEEYVDSVGNVIKRTIWIPTVNNLVRVSELRAFEIQQVDYKDRFNVFSNLNSSLGLDTENQEVRDFLLDYQNLTKLYDKLKYLCNLDFQGKLTSILLAQVSEKHFQEYFTILGSERIRALGYDVSLLNRELGLLTFDTTELLEKVYSTFLPGNRYTSVDIKQMLSIIYNEVGYGKTPIATDLEDWFEIKRVQINTKVSRGVYKRDKGFEIISKKGARNDLSY